MPWRGRQRSPGAGRAAPKRGWGKTWITSCVIDKQGNCQCSLAQTAEARRASSRSLTASSTARRARRLSSQAIRAHSAPGRCVREHLVDGALVVIPALAVAPVLVGELVALVGRSGAGLEASELLVLVVGEEELDHHPAVGQQLLLEVGDVAVGPLPLGPGGEPLVPVHRP